MTGALAVTVIPAKAGIQTIDKPHKVEQQHKYDFVRCAEFYDELDSGLRRNDEVVDFAYGR